MQLTDRPRLARRDFFRVGLATFAGFELLPMIRPRNVQANEKVSPRGKADFCIFVFLAGGAPQLDTWDLKEGRWTPENFAVEKIRGELLWPMGQFPKLARQLDRVAIVRSTAAWESAHARAQYYMQVGHIFSPARINEMPAVGAVVAYEMQNKRRHSDYLPPFAAINVRPNDAGLVKQGCLPEVCAPLALSMDQQIPFLVPPAEQAMFDRRWKLLKSLDGTASSLDKTHRSARTFESFLRTSHGMMTSHGLSDVFTLREEDRKRYGSSTFGDGCLLARQLLQADAGTRYALVAQNGWDLHVNMYDPKAKTNHYTLCREFDDAFPALLDDLHNTLTSDGRTMLERTFVVVLGEFGRTGGDLTVNKGRDHNQYASTGLFAGAGVRGGAVFGVTDEKGERVIKPEWHENRPIYPEDVIATIYSQLGIDWTKKITNTPSGRAFEYIEPQSGTNFVRFRDVNTLFS